MPRRFQITQEENFFFGLVVQTEFGATRIIDFFTPDRQQFVEYDISYLIDTAVTRQKKRVGILSPLEMMGDSGYMAQMMRIQGQQPRQKWGIIAQLEQKYEVVTVPTDTTAIEDIDLLLVIHPKDLPEHTEYAIDQYVLGGGRAVVMIDPHAVIDMPDQMSRLQGVDHPTSSNLPRLLRAWGLEMPDYTFAGDRELAVEGRTAPNRPPERILGFLQLQRDKGCFNPDHVVSANLNQMTVLFPGVLKVRSEANSKLEYVPLLSTSERGNAWRVNTPYELLVPDYTEFMRRFIDGTEPVKMGYLVTGAFKTAFPDGIMAEPMTTKTIRKRKCPAADHRRRRSGRARLWYWHADHQRYDGIRANLLAWQRSATTAPADESARRPVRLAAPDLNSLARKLPAALCAGGRY